MHQELWSEIRRLCISEKLPQREVARRLRIDRGTVKRALKSETIPRYQSRKVRQSKLDVYKGEIKELICQYPKLSATRVLEEIRKKGYCGGITIVADYLQRLRPSKKEAFLRIETMPGEEAQVDWTDCGKIMVENAWRRLSCFVMILSYSRLLYLEFTLSQSMEDFIEAHINAFKYFGGVPKRVLYDNLRSVVLWRDGSKIGFNRRFMDFVGVYLFEPRLCRVFRGSDKGKVENAIKYVKSNFLSGRDFKGFDDLCMQSKYWRDNVANVRIHGTSRQRPIDRYQEEKSLLMPLPDKPYNVIIPVPVNSSHDCRIKFDSNIYSVPQQYANKMLTVKPAKYEVCIYYKDRLVANHKRSWGKYKIIEDFRHIQELLKMKKKAIVSKIKDEFISLGEGAQKYFDGMAAKDCNLPKELARILKLRHIYGVTEVLQAINEAQRFEAFGASYIHNIIIANRTKRGESVINEAICLPENVADTHIEEKHPSMYDMLLMEENENE